MKSGPIETSNSDAKHTVIHAQKDRSCLGPIDTCYSGPEGAVLPAKAAGVVRDPQRLVIFFLKSLFRMHKTTCEGWNPYSLDTLMLSTLLCVLKTADEVCDPYRLISPDLKSLFCIQKNIQMRAGTHLDLSF